jgi:hypothetical protein
LQDAYPFMPLNWCYYFPVSPKIGVTWQLSLILSYIKFMQNPLNRSEAVIRSQTDRHDTHVRRSFPINKNEVSWKTYSPTVLPYDTKSKENDGSNYSSIVACVFVAV